MTLIPLALLSVALVCASAQRFSDYDYQDSFDNNQQQQQYQPTARPATRAKATTTTPPPPAAILKQINTHNEDGSYTYGYEADDGSFKIETKSVSGEVMGKYGYVDTDGKLRTVEYGANRFGFQPSGTGITVPPPTLVDESTRRGPNDEIIQVDEEEEQQQYRPRPSAQARPVRPRQQIQPRPRPQQVFEPQPQAFAPRQQQQQQQQYQPQSQYQPQQQQQPQYQQQPQQQQAYVAPQVRPRPSAGPVPPRAVVPGAAIASPQPPRPQIPGAFPAPAAPVYEAADPVFQQAPRRKPSRPVQRSSSSMLDDLAQQYALPSNPATRPVADFAFRSDDSAYSRTINF